MGLTVESGYHSGIKDASDRAIGFSGMKQAPTRRERLPMAKRLDIVRSLARRVPMRPVKR